MGDFMMRTMVFIDYQNFNINLHNHFANNGAKIQSINYQKLAKAINDILPFKSQVVKTYLFAYKPCDKLLELDRYSRYYDWLSNLRKTPYFEIIEGRQEIRNIKGVKLDIDDPKTYTTEEKETDINLATHMLAKGFQNAYDIAILVSGDTDYIKVVETLHNIGKTVVIAHFPHQAIEKYNGIIDSHIVLYDNLLSKAYNHKKNNNHNIVEDNENTIEPEVIVSNDEKTEMDQESQEQ